MWISSLCSSVISSHILSLSRVSPHPTPPPPVFGQLGIVRKPHKNWGNWINKCMLNKGTYQIILPFPPPWEAENCAEEKRISISFPFHPIISASFAYVNICYVCQQDSSEIWGLPNLACFYGKTSLCIPRFFLTGYRRAENLGENFPQIFIYPLQVRNWTMQMPFLLSCEWYLFILFLSGGSMVHEFFIVVGVINWMENYWNPKFRTLAGIT